jgi:hypothetical protein
MNRVTSAAGCYAHARATRYYSRHLASGRRRRDGADSQFQVRKLTSTSRCQVSNAVPLKGELGGRSPKIADLI